MQSNQDDGAWFAAEQARVIDYFWSRDIIPPTNLQVEFDLAPKVALWSECDPAGGRRIWVISGDCPTDFVVLDPSLRARDALAHISARWQEVATQMRQGRQHPTIRIGEHCNPQQLTELGDLLESRARLLHSFSLRDEIWAH